MGLIQSTIDSVATEPKNALQTNEIKIESEKSDATNTENIFTVTNSSNVVIEPASIEISLQNIIKSDDTQSVEKVLTEPAKPNEQSKDSMVFERYIENTGTKIEVISVEVSPSVDVVKKSNKKHKNNNKD